MISKSPNRHTIQEENYISRCEEKGEKPNEDYLNMYKSWRKQDEENMVDPAWQKNNMEYDLRSTEWILEKVRNSDRYAQNLYAAMCNMRWCKRELWATLAEDYWSASWRHAGGIVADMRQEGDYIDWYCSGMGGLNREYDGEETNEQWQARTGYVSESVITEEIELDLNKLGWYPVPWKDDDL
jgi:hypothetical protein